MSIYPPLTPTVSVEEKQRAVRPIRQLLARVQAGPEQDRWPGGEGAPDLIVLLLRSAPIPFAAVEGCAEAHGIPLPPAIRAHIGLELFRAYGEEQGWARGYSFMLLDEGERDGYRTWLANHDYAQNIVAGMQGDAASAGVPRPERVLIYDDWECEGSTLFAARHLVRQAFPGTGVEVHLAMGTPNKMIEVQFGGPPLAKKAAEDARSFLYELARGYRETLAGLVPLDNRQQLQRLGQQAPYRRGGTLTVLTERYGEEQLLAFPERVRAAFRNWGQTIDPALPPPPKSVVLLSGPPGSGKMAVLRQTLAHLLSPAEEQTAPGGFLIVAGPDGNGFDLLSIKGERVPLARAGRHSFAEPVEVVLPDGCTYAVDRAALNEVGCASLALTMLGQPALIGKIGPLLFASDEFCELLWHLLEWPRPLLGVITAHAHPFADRIKAHPAVELVEVTAENRERLPDELARRFAPQLQASLLPIPENCLEIDSPPHFWSTPLTWMEPSPPGRCI